MSEANCREIRKGNPNPAGFARPTAVTRPARAIASVSVANCREIKKTKHFALLAKWWARLGLNQ
ncbi:MAG TPA: hypothetical protein PLG99_09355 [Kaistiaceae bacterium]|nr:hypothetical protein [Kaistiaceae bacterium]